MWGMYKSATHSIAPTRQVRATQGWSASLGAKQVFLVVRAFFVLSCLGLASGCDQIQEQQKIRQKNVAWNPKIELNLTWPEGPNGPRGRGVYSSLFDLYTLPIDTDTIIGDYLVVANRFPETSGGSASIVLSKGENQNLPVRAKTETTWNIVRASKVNCPNQPKTIIPDDTTFIIDARHYVLICVSDAGISRLAMNSDYLGSWFPEEVSQKARDHLKSLEIVIE
jgi:hypothetical protein